MKVIVSTKIVELYGNTYREITFHDGEKQLARYHPKHKMWAILKFAQNT